MSDLFLNEFHPLYSELQCCVCQKLLSVGPISTLIDLGNICGRCITGVKQAQPVHRQFVFENLMKNYTFPCSNKSNGCDLELAWGTVEAHELACKYQKITCPMVILSKNGCKWLGNLSNFMDHIVTTHKVLVIDPPQITFKNQAEVFFTHLGDQIVTIYYKKFGDKFRCFVLSKGSDTESQCYRYQLELFNQKKDNSIILRKNRLSPLLQFDEKTCEYLEIDAKKMREMLKEQNNIIGKFGIVKKSKKEITKITGGKEVDVACTSVTPKQKQTNLYIDEQMLLELECPVCNEYMVSPIYICNTGHSICKNCKSKIKTCPTCRHPLQNTRNYTLEKLTTRVNYPCKHREIGCPFITTADKIRDHEVSCEFNDLECCLGRCFWRGKVPAMYGHIQEKHAESILENSADLMYDTQRVTKKDNNSLHAIYHRGQLFRLSIKQSPGKNPILFCLQHLGMTPDKPKFSYKVQLVDKSKLKRNFCFIQPVHAYLYRESEKGGFSIPYDIYNNFVFENHFFYYNITILDFKA